MKFDDIKPMKPLDKKEEELNEENDWLKAIKGDSNVGTPAIRKPRMPGRLVSRSQRTAIVNEKDAEAGRDLNTKQRKATHGY